LPATGVAALKASIPASRTTFFHKPRMPAHQPQVHTVLTGALPSVNSFCRFFMAEVHQLTCLTRKYLS